MDVNLAKIDSPEKCLTSCLNLIPAQAFDRVLVGVLPGEGIGPEVIAGALTVLNAVTPSERELVVEFGGKIGRESEAAVGESLSPGVVEFCEDIFGRGGAILSGSSAGR